MLYKDYLKTMTVCPFCLKQDVFAENATAYLTYSLAPYHEGHMLVIPKRHVVNLEDFSTGERADIDALVVRSVSMLKKAGYEHLSVLVRDGKVDPIKSNKSIDHLHYHVVPDIRIGDLDHIGHEREILDGDALTQMVDRFRSLFS